MNYWRIKVSNGEGEFETIMDQKDLPTREQIIDKTFDYLKKDYSNPSHPLIKEDVVIRSIIQIFRYIP